MNSKNVLVILCDQLRKDCLGCYGNPYIKTPNIDALAREGLRFNRNYVVNPICMPNRLSLFTGMYPRNHGVWTNGLLVRDDGYTMMDRLTEAGYQTANIGKIHFEPMGNCGSSRESHSYWEGRGGVDGFHGPYWGFDYVEITNSHGGASMHMVKWYYENGGTDDMLVRRSASGDRDGGVRSLPDRLTSSAFVGERTVNYLENIRDKEKPFFLVASFPDPHHPFVASEERMAARGYDNIGSPVGTPEDLQSRPLHYRQHLVGSWGRAGSGGIATRPGGIPEAVARERTAHTYAMIELIDEYVGMILSSVREQGLADDTIIIFTSDHGELLGDFGLWHKGPFFYEGMIGTPMILSMPGTNPGVKDSLFSAVDMAPTILDLLGIGVPFYMDGISQASIVRGETDSVRDHCLADYRNGFGDKDRNSKALVTKDYKYVRHQTGERELNDLINDSEEKKNVSGDAEYYEIERQMENRLLDALLSTESKIPAQLCHA